jgi:hypothetical protein
MNDAEKEALLKLVWRNPTRDDPRKPDEEKMRYYTREIERLQSQIDKLMEAKRVAEERLEDARKPAEGDLLFSLLAQEQRRQQMDKKADKKKVLYEEESEEEGEAVPIKRLTIGGVVYDTADVKGVKHAYKKGTKKYLGVVKYKRMDDTSELVPYIVKDVRYTDPFASDSDSD